MRRVAWEVVRSKAFRLVAVTGRGDADYAEVVLLPPRDLSDDGPIVLGVSRRTSEPSLRQTIEHLLSKHLGTIQDNVRAPY